MALVPTVCFRLYVADKKMSYKKNQLQRPIGRKVLKYRDTYDD